MLPNSLPWAGIVPKDWRANLDFRHNLLVKAENDVGLQKALKEACRDDFIFYFRAFAWQCNPIESDKLKRVGPFIPYPFQDHLLKWLIESIEQPIHGIRLIKKSRRMGLTWLCLILMDAYCRFHENIYCLAASREEDLVDKTGDHRALFWKLDFIDEHLPHWMRHKRGPSDRIKNHFAYPETGSCIDGESTNRNLARGDRRLIGFMDEKAAMPNGEAINAATTDAFHIRIDVSTPDRKPNSFKRDEKRLIESGLKDHIEYVHWHEHPEYSKGLYTVTKDGDIELIDKDFWNDPANFNIRPNPTSPKSKRYDFRSPWYDEDTKRRSELDIATNLDLDDEGATSLFYDAGVINRLLLFCRQPLDVGLLDYDIDTGKPIRWRSGAEGKIQSQLWCELRLGKPANDRTYFVGADVSGGAGTTNSVLAVCDGKTRECIAMFCTPFLRPERFAALAVAVCRWFSNRDGDGAILNFEPQGPGASFKKSCVDLGYRRFFHRKIETSMGFEINPEPGTTATPRVKRLMHEFYRACLEAGTIKVYDEDSLAECLEYVWTTTDSVDHVSSADRDLDPSEAKANHGDRATATALANLAMNFDRDQADDPVYAEIDPQPRSPVGSLAWLREKRLNSELAMEY